MYTQTLNSETILVDFYDCSIGDNKNIMNNECVSKYRI